MTTAAGCIPPHVLAAIEAAADRQYAEHPGSPLPADSPVRRLLPPAEERAGAA